MTQEVPKKNWKSFFDDLTKRRFEWQTKIEVLSEEIGSQVLDEGLPLVGITADTRGDDTTIEIMVGQDDDHHQTHNIRNPIMIAYLSDEDSPSGIVEFEEESGTKTLVHIIQPMPLVVKYVGSEMTAA